jgi:hypothetical protein
MKIASTLILSLALLVGCQPAAKNFEPSQHLSMEQLDSVKRNILPYLAKLPKRATHDTKFNPSYGTYYDGLMEQFQWRAIWPGGDGSYYFLIDRPAPSLYQKRIAIAGKLSFSPDSYEITTYEEAFWTFKMKEEELAKKATMLFDLYVDGQSLEAYLPMKSEEEYIEFPDALNRFDVESRRWRFGPEGDDRDKSEHGEVNEEGEATAVQEEVHRY